MPFFRNYGQLFVSLLFVCLNLHSNGISVSSPDFPAPIVLLPEVSSHEKMSGSNHELKVFCVIAKPKQLTGIWQTASIWIDLDSDYYDKFEGATVQEVMENYSHRRTSWSPSIFPYWKERDIKIDPFNSTCLGIYTNKSYKIVLHLTHLNNWQFFKFTIGFLLFLFANKLSSNQLFYYICGIAFGICASVIILIYLLSRLLPNKPIMYGVVLGGWTISIYFLKYLLENVKVIITDYYQYVFGYICLNGVISFAICYRLGPLSNPRSRKLIQWLLQLIGLLLIFHSSYVYEVTYVIDLILIISRLAPFSIFIFLIKFLKKKLIRFKIKLLTKKEYIEQGRRETKKALEELRDYCSSPKCNQWKTVLRLKNPSRFAEFMEGSFHVSEDEIEEYESLSYKPNGTIITDDSDNSVIEYTEDD